MSTEDQSASGHGSLENFNIPQAYGELPSDLDDSSNPHQDFSQSQFIPVVEDNTFQGQDFYTGHGPLRFPLQTQGPEPLGSQFIEHHSHPGVDSFDTMAINSLPRDIGTSYHGSHVIPTLPQMAYPHPGLPVEASGLASEDFRRNLAMDAPGDVHSTPGQLMEPHVFPYQHWEHGVPSLGALTSNARPGYIGEPLEEPLTATLNTGTTVPFENSPNERQQYSFSGLGYLNDGVGVIPQTQLDGSSDPADHENYIQLQTHGRTTYVMGTAGMPDARYDRSSHRILHEETSPASPSGPQSWSSSGAAYNGNLGRESGTGTDGYHRLSRGLYLNTQPSPSQGASFENSFLSPQGSFHSPSPHSPPSTGKASGSRRGRKGPLTPEQRAHAKQTREQKACDECHIKKTRCPHKQGPIPGSMEYLPVQRVTQAPSNMQPNNLSPITMTDESNVEQSLGTQSALNTSQHRKSQSPFQDDTCDMGSSSATGAAPRHLNFQDFQADPPPAYASPGDISRESLK